MVGGREVVVEYDQDRSDKYNRTLAYLYLADGTFVNLEMIRQGYAHAYVKYPFREQSRFRAAEREARAAERGLWSDSAGDSTLSAAAIQTRPSTARVWVNTSSGVYHCEGTRYYGNTKRGAFMTESAARAEGRRPAGGRPCG
jgi:micrococcal nuclease